ncbi:MAG: 4'-phosphopantetheinyl transferase superfamily protein, partial [Ornithinimicrobium sp.]
HVGVTGEVGRRRDRSPSWPAGAVGSIAHCAHLALAVAASARDLTGLGVDVEDDAAVPVDLTSVVLTSAERAYVTGERAHLLPAMFSMKEAAYKCWYPLTEVELDFTDIQVNLDAETGAFRADMVTAVLRRPMHLPVHGRMLRQRGHVYAAAWTVYPGPRQSRADPTTGPGSG